VAAHTIVSHQQWVAARKKHLDKEKEFTHLRDQLSRERRELPWELVDKDYRFVGARGPVSLQEMFDGRTQLVVYHAMFNPATAGPRTSWTADAACYTCSWWMDNFNGVTVHLNHRDITMVAVSLAPFDKLAAYQKRMGWSFPWFSSAGSNFNFDYHVSFLPEQLNNGKYEYNYRDFQPSVTELPGISVFLRDGGNVYHTYSTYARGIDMLNVAYNYMDLVPKGRDEAEGGAAAWLRRHDEYSA
jgi:predicted dithiol-disulfide oxidoreductase (DUF899 family)